MLVLGDVERRVRAAQVLEDLQRCAGSRRRCAAPAPCRRAARGWRAPPRPRRCRCPAAARTRGSRRRSRRPPGRLQMDAVMALKDASHEPQSRSIACLVSSEVVRGPGVSRMGSLPRIMEASPGLRSACGRATRCRQHSRRTHTARERHDDQRRHRRGRADVARLVQVHDRHRREHRLRRIQEHHRGDRRHRVHEEVAADVEHRRQAHRHRHAEEGRQNGTLSEADTASNSLSICFSAVTAVRCDDV